MNVPEGANPGSTRIDIFKHGENTALAGAYGGHVFELLPGSYDAEISKKRLEGVAIQSAHDTRVKVGVLQIYAGENTRVEVVDRDGYSDRRIWESDNRTSCWHLSGAGGRTNGARHH